MRSALEIEPASAALHRGLLVWLTDKRRADTDPSVGRSLSGSARRGGRRAGGIAASPSGGKKAWQSFFIRLIFPIGGATFPLVQIYKGQIDDLDLFFDRGEK